MRRPAPKSSSTASSAPLAHFPCTTIYQKNLITAACRLVWDGKASKSDFFNHGFLSSAELIYMIYGVIRYSSFLQAAKQKWVVWMNWYGIVWI